MKKVKLQIIATMYEDGKNDVRIECDMSTLVTDAAVVCMCAVDGLRDSARMVIEAENVKDVNDIESVVNSKLDNMTFKDVLDCQNKTKSANKTNPTPASAIH